MSKTFITLCQWCLLEGAGSAVCFTLTGGSSDATVRILQSTFIGNVATGLGLCVLCVFNAGSPCTIDCVARVVSSAGNGGALLIANGQDTPLNIGYCCSSPLESLSCPELAPPPEFRQWSFNSTIMIADSSFIDNAANTTCETCSGGAIAIQSGGDVSLTNCSFVNNSAEFFGGGVFIGGPAPGYASCALNVSGSSFLRNSIARSGSQLYSSCGGSIDFSGARFEMQSSATEVM
jgi:hypothetical protein